MNDRRDQIAKAIPLLFYIMNDLVDDNSVTEAKSSPSAVGEQFFGATTGKHVDASQYVTLSIGNTLQLNSVNGHRCRVNSTVLKR